MDLRKVKKLIEMLEASNLAELEMQEGEEAVRISRMPADMPPPANYANYATYATPPPAPPPVVADAAAPPAAAPAAAPADTGDGVKYKGKPVVSPMVGTFYRSPSPGAAAYVEVGQEVKAGDVVCIVEAMKMMNQIEAEHSGTVEAFLVEDGVPVEFEQKLLTIV